MARVKPILKQSPEQSLILGERYHAVADVAGRKDTILSAQTAGAAAIVGDCDDSGEIADRVFEIGRIKAAGNVLFQTPQQREKPRPSTQSNNIEPASPSP